MLILLLIGSSLLGITLIRVRGWYSLTRIKQQLTQGQLPTDALFGSLRWLVAGILFVIPGFVTDILACVLLSPFGRYLLNLFISSRLIAFRQNLFKTDRTFYSSQSNRQNDSEIFEAEFEKEADENKRLK